MVFSGQTGNVDRHVPVRRDAGQAGGQYNSPRAQGLRASRDRVEHRGRTPRRQSIPHR